MTPCQGTRLAIIATLNVAGVEGDQRFFRTEKKIPELDDVLGLHRESVDAWAAEFPSLREKLAQLENTIDYRVKSGLRL